MTTATTAPEIGTRVQAQPWIDGYEIPARSGIAIGGYDGYTTVWFPSLGEVDATTDGISVQSILNSKLTVIGHIRDYARPTLAVLYRRVRRRDCFYRHTDELIRAIGAAAEANGYLKNGKLT